ncbi:MAG: hypothetical protein QXV17_14030 [Candidatus Micrarchaeaceae archaeon]
MKNITKYLAFIPFAVTPFDIGSTVNNALSNLVNDLINIFDSFFQGLVNIFLGAINSALGGVLGFFGIPFHQWAVNVSQQGLMIPILFIGILGVAGAIGYFFFIIYGFEGDIRGGEEDIGREEENVEEEE